MASLLDLTKNLFKRDKPKKANPIIQFMDRDKSMPGFQAVPGGWEGAKARVKSQYQKEKQYTGASLREGVNLPIEADWGAIFPKAFEKLSKVNIPLSAGLPFLKALPADKQPKIPVGRILTGSLSTPQEIRDIKTKLQRQQPLTEPERKLAKNYFQNYAAGLTLDVAGLKSMGKVTSNADEVAEGLFSKDIQRYKSAEEFVNKSGIVPEWGTQNQYYVNNPFREQLDEMVKSKKYSLDILKKAEKWEMEQLLKDKPVFLSENLNKDEVIKFAKKNNLWFRSHGDDLVVAKDIDSLNRTLNALDSGNQREIGLSLGYKDIGIMGTGKARQAKSQLTDIYNQAKGTIRRIGLDL